MKAYFLALMVLSTSVFAQSGKESKDAAPVQEAKSGKQIVEAACAMCIFGMEGVGCKLAVKIDGEAYLVDGVDMHNLGDAHAHDGMCNVSRKAEVAGEVVDGRYKASAFTLLPVEEDAE